jgi:methylated-DNA-[protein]-cysteine S-methyltransferase
MAEPSSPPDEHPLARLRAANFRPMTLQRLPKQDRVACSGSSRDPRAARERAIGSRNRVEALLGYHAIIAAPFGCVGIRTDRQCVTTVTYLPPDTPLRPAFDPLARETCAQIAAYLRDPKHRFDLPYATKGSMFEQQVWRAIAAIPSGRTRTYGELARGLATAARPVGRACGSNPVPLLVPCHRVVAAGGGLGGFMHSRAAAELSIKHWLLRHEGCR